MSKMKIGNDFMKFFKLKIFIIYCLIISVRNYDYNITFYTSDKEDSSIDQKAFIYITLKHAIGYSEFFEIDPSQPSLTNTIPFQRGTKDRYEKVWAYAPPKYVELIFSPLNTVVWRLKKLVVRVRYGKYLGDYHFGYDDTKQFPHYTNVRMKITNEYNYTLNGELITDKTTTVQIDSTTITPLNEGNISEIISNFTTTNNFQELNESTTIVLIPPNNQTTLHITKQMDQTTTKHLNIEKTSVLNIKKSSNSLFKKTTTISSSITIFKKSSPSIRPTSPKLIPTTTDRKILLILESKLPILTISKTSQIKFTFIRSTRNLTSTTISSHTTLSTKKKTTKEREKPSKITVPIITTTITTTFTTSNSSTIEERRTTLFMKPPIILPEIKPTQNEKPVPSPVVTTTGMLENNNGTNNISLIQLTLWNTPDRSTHPNHQLNRVTIDDETKNNQSKSSSSGSSAAETISASILIPIILIVIMIIIIRLRLKSDKGGKHVIYRDGGMTVNTIETRLD
ncbi:hypothetical protein SNEBB_002610 [Seison nebaliae]|nr:hypothetical protein SNEBB_002610 [Seison nebaliae]